MNKIAFFIVILFFSLDVNSQDINKQCKKITSCFENSIKEIKKFQEKNQLKIRMPLSKKLKTNIDNAKKLYVQLVRSLTSEQKQIVKKHMKIIFNQLTTVEFSCDKLRMELQLLSDMNEAKKSNEEKANKETEINSEAQSLYETITSAMNELLQLKNKLTTI